MTKRKKPRARKGILNNKTLAVGALALVAVVAVAAWLAFDGGSTPKRKLVRQTPVVSTEKQVSVDVIDNDFTPRTLTVNKGATVTWKFTGDIPHNVTDDRGAFASDTLGHGEEFTRTFDAPGIFYYYCTIHHGMLGTLTVKE
jgi:plastocyanin